MRKKYIRMLCLFGPAFLFWKIAICQTDFTSSVSDLKNKYPKSQVVAANFKEEYNFTLDKSYGEPKVIVTANCSELLVPLKDYTRTTEDLFYNDESSVENVKAIAAKNKLLKLIPQCNDYQSEGVFHSDEKLCIINIPFEAKGSAINFSYDKKYKDVKYLTSVYFHEVVPVSEKTIVFNIPSWLDVELREFNFSGYDIKKETQLDPASKVTKYIFHLKNIDPLENEYHSPNMAKSFPHIIVLSKSFTDNNQKKILFENVKDLYAWYNSLCKQVNNSPDELKPVVSELIQNKKTDVEKIESIYYWVQEKVRYIAFENGIMGFKPEPAQNVLKNKYGDCKGKANLMTQMLKLAGYDARLTWIGTTDLPYDYSLPSLAVDNHMICTLIFGGKKYFLDGTEEHMAFNDYAHRIQGKQVLIQDGDSFILDKVPEFGPEHNKVETQTKLRIDGTDLKGTTTSIFNGEARNSLVSVYQSLRTENKQNALENFLRSGDANITITNIKNPDWQDRQKPAQVSHDLVAKNQITRTDKELYVIMDWEKEFSSFEFDTSRKNDYEMDYKMYETTQVDLTIPDGYKVDYTPENLSKKTSDYSFEGSYAVKGNTLTYTKKIIVNKVILRKSEFPAWNEFIRNINKFYNDQVILVKK